MHYKREEKAFRIHCEEMDRRDATTYNLGWGVNVNNNWISIASKTSKGVLTTNIDFNTTPIDIEHSWRDY